ncbi:hypothetical protein HDE68_004220 [Pedobacter cryoconitis]|uniref:3-keto-disaccharide hydrolase domain-containing protein n=1 Tax=Pedobacter cryoconitis TaxID=188932 RepID=A0A7W8ZQF9_9SPHI|nr:hypothetical protein [Pedobacter cryoconitis]MBB5638291.1 hypothetical protein [Pedobacter cryoconitis]
MKRIISFLLLTIAGYTAQAQTRTLFQETYKSNSLKKNWSVINGDWKVNELGITGNKNTDWAILISKKTLPKDYILTFSSLVDPKAYLFEVITNLNGEKYLGFLLNQLENRVAIEDRSLFADPVKKGTFIHSTGHIGLMPKVKKPSEHIWQNWKIQKTGNQIFVWINNDAIISLNDTTGFVKPKGTFGFAINGEAMIKDVKLIKTRGEASLPPKSFVLKSPVEKPFFVFE